MFLLEIYTKYEIKFHILEDKNKLFIDIIPTWIPRPHLAEKMAKKRKLIVIRKLDCVSLYAEESERKGKYEDGEEVNQQMRKKRKTKRKNKGFGFGKLKQHGRKYRK